MVPFLRVRDKVNEKRKLIFHEKKKTKDLNWKGQEKYKKWKMKKKRNLTTSTHCVPRMPLTFFKRELSFAEPLLFIGKIYLSMPVCVPTWLTVAPMDPCNTICSILASGGSCCTAFTRSLVRTSISSIATSIGLRTICNTTSNVVLFFLLCFSCCCFCFFLIWPWKTSMQLHYIPVTAFS